MSQTKTNVRRSRAPVPSQIEPGVRFGKWIVLERNPHIRHGKVLCRCDCGRERKVFVSNLRSGLSTSCGCPKVMEPGMIQGKLSILGHPWVDEKGRARVKCKCECGRIYYPRVDDLIHGKIKSCRCTFLTQEHRLRMRKKALEDRSINR